MRVHRMLVPVLALAISAPAAAQDQLPVAFRSLQPAQIVEVLAAERQTLDLTIVQTRQLDSLTLAIRREPHRYETAPSPGKAHRNARMQPMISKQRAYADALGILTPEQRARAAALFRDPGYRLPTEFQTRAAEAGESATEPLQRHGAVGAAAGQSTKSGDSAKEPLQHHGGETPAVAADESGEPTDPVTHKR